MSEKLTAWINDKAIQFTDGQTILEVAREHQIFIPTLCAYLPLDHTPGTCRMCLVELADAAGEPSRVVTACTTPLKAGQCVHTRSRRIREMQRTQMQLMFADHDQDCKSCHRHGDCELQDVALFIGMDRTTNDENYFVNRTYDDSSIAIIRDTSKCIRCGRCVEVCRQVQGISALTIKGQGTGSGVGLVGTKFWADSDRCIQCGQCTVVCPTGALSVKDQCEEVLQMIDDPTITTVVQIAPAVRVTLGEEFKLEPGTNVEGRMVTALRQIGVDYVMDTNFAADMVIMEEGTELLERLGARARGEKVALPMFTSCCPGWVNYVEQHEPAIGNFLSTTRSPQAVFGTLAKTYLPEKLGVKRENLRVISIMPCTAKKGEAAREQLMTDNIPDVDVVLTVRELAKLLRRGGVHLKFCEESPFDTPLFTDSTGAAVIFGTTGGVMEAAVRTLYALTHDGQSLEPLVYEPVRGLEGVKEATANLGPYGDVRLAVVHGIARTQALIERLKNREVDYDFIEVMACPGGCISGGGTPRKKNQYLFYAKDRQEGLYAIDEKRPVRESHKSEQVQKIYAEALGHPGSHLAHTMLHTHYGDRQTKDRVADVRVMWDKLSQLTQKK